MASPPPAASLPPAAAFYVPSLPTLPGLLHAHPTHPLNVWAGLLPSGDPAAAADAGGEKDDKILCVRRLLRSLARGGGRSRPGRRRG